MTNAEAGSLTLGGLNTFSGGTNVPAGNLTGTGYVEAVHRTHATRRYDSRQGLFPAGCSTSSESSAHHAGAIDYFHLAPTHGYYSQWRHGGHGRSKGVSISKISTYRSLKGPPVTTKSGEQGATEAVRVFPYPLSVEQAAKLLGTPAPAPPEPAAHRQPQTHPQRPARSRGKKLPGHRWTRSRALTKAAGGYVDTSNSAARRQRQACRARWS